MLEGDRGASPDGGEQERTRPLVCPAARHGGGVQGCQSEPLGTGAPGREP